MHLDDDDREMKFFMIIKNLANNTVLPSCKILDTQIKDSGFAVHHSYPETKMVMMITYAGEKGIKHALQFSLLK